VRERRVGRVVIGLSGTLALAGAVLLVRGIPSSPACLVADGVTLACLLLTLLALGRLVRAFSPGVPRRDRALDVLEG